MDATEIYILILFILCTGN